MTPKKRSIVEICYSVILQVNMLAGEQFAPNHAINLARIEAITTAALRELNYEHIKQVQHLLLGNVRRKRSKSVK